MEYRGAVGLFLLTILVDVSGHGRLFDPPSRASAWRVGFKTPPNTNDMEGFCGGFERQWLVNKGRCGICGDPYDEKPRPHEAPGGIYATGTITRTYTEGQVIPVTIQITATHRGYYEFKLCPNVNPAQDPPQECFEPYPLTFVGGTTGGKFYLTKLPAATYRARLQLPKGVSCQRCIIQWTYVTGNRWGICQGGKGELGCGPQEMFRACSDVTILPSGVAPGPTQPSPTIPSFIPSPAPETWPPVTPATIPTVTRPVETAPPIEVTTPTLAPTRPPTTRRTTAPYTEEIAPEWVLTGRPATIPEIPRPTTEIPGVTVEPETVATAPPTIPIEAPFPGTTAPARRCVPVGDFKQVTGAAEWCGRNCRGGFCPAEFCACQ